MHNASTFASPLQSLDEWEDDLLVRYPEPKNSPQKKTPQTIEITMIRPVTR